LLYQKFTATSASEISDYLPPADSELSRPCRLLKLLNPVTSLLSYALFTDSK